MPANVEHGSHREVAGSTHHQHFQATVLWNLEHPQHNTQFQIKHHQQTQGREALTVGDCALFQIGFSAGMLVMMQVEVATCPRIDGAGAANPHQSHHEVVHELVLAEIHVVNQVMFQLVRKAQENRNHWNGHVPGQHAFQISPTSQHRTCNREQQNGHADQVLML